jgi:hypothetical protein
VRMDRTLYKGTLVRIRSDALNISLNREWVEESGWLWVVEEDGPPSLGMYRCKALATGASHPWYPSELEINRGGGSPND